MSSIRPRTPRLRRSNCSGPGMARRRSGRGFVYLDEDGQRVSDDLTLARIRALAIPPAWQDVWICPDPQGHLQATGVDAAGRRQYLYHERWRALRDRKKFEQMVDFGWRLPALRGRARVALQEEALSQERVLGCAVRLLDLGLFRVGGSTGDEDSGLGLATLRREHLTITAGAAVFDFPAKWGVRQVVKVSDPACLDVLIALRRRRSGPEELLSFRDSRSWRPLHAEAINLYIKDALGSQFSAKDFRTWHANVVAAVGLAQRIGERRNKTARARAIRAVSVEVAEALGNTPAVARRAYMDPRVVDRYESGWVIKLPAAHRDGIESLSERHRRTLELALLDLLAGDTDHHRVVRHRAG